MPQELLARIESVLRRANGHQSMSQVFRIGALTINEEAYQAKLNGKRLTLTRKEFKLLQILAENSHRVYSREQLLYLVWGEDHQSSEKTVDTHIKTLRLKMGNDGNCIKTIWGVGYRRIFRYLFSNFIKPGSNYT